jgi:hypothetical protein
MKLICAIVLSFLTSEFIEEVKISDPDVINVLNIYIDSLNHKVSSQTVKYHLVARIDNEGTKKIIYVSATPFIGEFWRNIPDEYSKFGDRLVFWYKGKGDNRHDDSYKEFHSQFNKLLVNDRLADGTHDPQIETEFIGLEFIGSYRFVVRKGKVESVKKVCSFPNNRFYDSGYKFDSHGNLMFNDGAYDLCSIDKPYRFDRDNFDPMDYIRTNSGIPNEVTKKHRLVVTITIDKKGKPTKVDVDDADKVLNSQQLNTLSEVILRMPKWNPQTVKGKKVCYRITIKL